MGARGIFRGVHLGDATEGVSFRRAFRGEAVVELIGRAVELVDLLALALVVGVAVHDIGDFLVGDAFRWRVGYWGR